MSPPGSETCERSIGWQGLANSFALAPLRSFVPRSSSSQKKKKRSVASSFMSPLPEFFRSLKGRLMCRSIMQFFRDACNARPRLTWIGSFHSLGPLFFSGSNGHFPNDDAHHSHHRDEPLCKLLPPRRLMAWGPELVDPGIRNQSPIQ